MDVCVLGWTKAEQSNVLRTATALTRPPLVTGLSEQVGPNATARVLQQVHEVAGQAVCMDAQAVRQHQSTDAVMHGV